jgi:hypothetical protein
MGASGNTGLPHIHRHPLSLSLSVCHTFSRFQASVACGVLIKILLKYYLYNTNCIKMIKGLERLKNAVNEYMAELRPTSQNGGWS